MPVGVFQKGIKRRKAATDVVGNDGMTLDRIVERRLVFLAFDMFVIGCPSRLSK